MQKVRVDSAAQSDSFPYPKLRSHTQTSSQSVHLFFRPSKHGRRADISNTQINYFQASTRGERMARNKLTSCATPV
jgi:hypothetical protein